jgi:DNA-binding winged helix-turn-helix (wHTH) protein
MRFTDCIFDPEARLLFRGGNEVHLSRKAFDLLQLLVECRPRAVPKTELLDRVWPGIFVSDASLAKVVNEIRQAVGDDAHEPRIIRTFHGHGYAFVADVLAEPPKKQEARKRTACWLESDDRDLALGEGELIVGRDPSLELWLDSPRVSRRHARLSVAGTSVTIEDLGSKNGTYVGDRRITSPTVLLPGDEVRFGPFKFVFRAYEPGGLTETEVFSRVPK